MVRPLQWLQSVRSSRGGGRCQLVGLLDLARMDPTQSHWRLYRLVNVLEVV